jgi:hypothetical protein
METPFKDFDAVVREVEDRPVGFRVGGEDFTANLNTNAGAMLKWMRSGSRIESIPTMLIALMSEAQYERMEDVLIKKNIPYETLEEVILWLAEQMGSSGN